jgi:hypothetical protein
MGARELLGQAEAHDAERLAGLVLLHLVAQLHLAPAHVHHRRQGEPAVALLARHQRVEVEAQVAGAEVVERAHVVSCSA